MDELNPQAEQMADESMVRNSPPRRRRSGPRAPILRRHVPPEAPRILDGGCGTGEASRRLAELFPRATVLGADVLEPHLARAREASRHLGDRVRFENRTLFGLGLPDASFDLVVCRHVLQAIPGPERAVAELVRVTRPGGTVHLVAEDYAMIHFPPRRLDPAEFWPAIPARFGAAIGTDMFFGRRAPRVLHELGVRRIAVDYVAVDTIRAPRETFAAIWEAWRDGYVDAIAEHCGVTRAWARDHFDDQIATLRDPASYAVWLVPVVSGVRG
jgi:SAM-dependent methyltransferase